MLLIMQFSPASCIVLLRPKVLHGPINPLQLMSSWLSDCEVTNLTNTSHLHESGYADCMEMLITSY